MIKPNDFAGQPYLYLLNQAGHFLLGFFGVNTYVWLILVTADIYLDQNFAFAGLVLFYFLVVELTLQGWRGLDTAQDTLYFSLGAGAWLSIDMSEVIHRIMLFEVLLIVCLGAGVLREFSRQNAT